MSFTFEYDDALYDAEWDDHCLWGCVRSGSMHVGEPISVATSSGDQLGIVNTFWDTMHDWLAMPFYHSVNPETVGGAFCVRVFGLSAMPQCPGVARSPTPGGA